MSSPPDQQRPLDPAVIDAAIRALRIDDDDQVSPDEFGDEDASASATCSGEMSPS